MSKVSNANGPQFANISLPSNPDTNAGEPPLLHNTVESSGDQPAPSHPTLQSKPKPARAPKRRASDSEPQGPTIDNVRELLLGDTIKKSQQELEVIERNTSDQLELLREDMASRIDRVVRVLSTVNQAVRGELAAREEAVRCSEEALTAKTEALEAKMEDRLSFLEAKIYTVVADAERKLAMSQATDKDNIVAKFAERELAVDQRIDELTKTVEDKMQAFGERITSEIGQVSDAVAEAQVKAGEEAEALGGQVGQRLGAVETQLATDLSKLRGELGASSTQLRSELATQVGQQQALLAQMQVDTQNKLVENIEQLEGRKVSRTDFSVLLQELATRLEADDLGSAS